VVTLRRGGTALATLLLGAACTAAPARTPAVTPLLGSTPALPSTTAHERATPRPRPETPKPPGIGPLELDHESLDPAWTRPLLEFASDGASIIFSSGVADGPDGEFAPDLWRYTPGAAGPELLWHNPRRDRSLVRIGGDRDVWAFVEIPADASRAWDLWLLTDPGGEPRLLDTHPGDDDVPSLVPSFVVHDAGALPQVAWTAFDRGAEGPVSQLMYAAGPAWEPRVLAERPAQEAELWFPSLRGTMLAYTEVVYSADRLTDSRYVYLADAADPAIEPVRLDTSGRAAMPLLVDDGVVWKEADAGFSMFNWGRLFFYDLRSGDVSRISMSPQEYVNYPSAGLRFLAAWGSNAFSFAVHDLDLEVSRRVARYDPATHQSVFRPHVAGDLLVWLYTTVGDTTVAGDTELRYAYLPGAGTDREP
jgi:hypothetical protein